MTSAFPSFREVKSNAGDDEFEFVSEAGEADEVGVLGPGSQRASKAFRF